MWFYRAFILIFLLTSLDSCDRVRENKSDARIQAVLEFRNKFWETGDTIYLQQGIIILDSLLNADLEQQDLTYCENLKEQMLLDNNHLRDAMTLRGQSIDSVKHPEDYYEFMAILSYCNNDFAGMHKYSRMADIEFEKLFRNSTGDVKVDFLQRQIDTNILCCNYHVAESLYNQFRPPVIKDYYKSFDDYYQQARSNLEDLKRQYNKK